MFLRMASADISGFSGHAIAIKHSAVDHRELENDGDGSYDFDLSSYKAQVGNCFRVKIVNENDDDGNAYFYNGAYRAQFQRYTSFYLCEGSSESTCKMFVTDLQSFLESSVAFVEKYCYSCKSSCSRRLEDGENQIIAVDCNSCSSQCKSMLQAVNNENTMNAVNYLDCQESYNDGNLQYYSAPQCGNSENRQYVTIGQFYDADCTIKLNSDDSSSKLGLSYSYEAFETLAAMKIDCSISSDFCSELASFSIYCEGDLDEQNNKLCKAARQAGRINTYYKKHSKFPWVPLLLVALVLSFVFAFLSWSYYVRHSRETHPAYNTDYKLESDGDAHKENKTSDLPTIA